MTTGAFVSDSAQSGLSEEECRTLLRSRTLGRVALVSGALPAIVPVEYVYDESTITFRSEHDAKLRGVSTGDVLAFEVDSYDPESGDVASVHVLGRMSVLTEPVAPGVAPHAEYVRLHCEIVNGRRVRSPRD
jgi:nitroimidazol reductase NimA-like FMN-containing flavoprotein (pyridoxamine 5'-phosphate oxidase superfamily)